MGDGASGAATAVRRRVGQCKQCHLSEFTRPVPFSGSAPNHVLVVGANPGKVEAQTGRPFVGPSGALLRSIATQFGNDPASWSYTNTAQCSTPGDREPHKAELIACSSNLSLVIAVVDPDVIVLAGAVALHAFYPDAKIGKEHGRPFLLPRPGGATGPHLVSIDLGTGIATTTPTTPERLERVMLPVIHPAAALHAPSNLPTLESDLRLLTRGLRHGWLDLWPDACTAHSRDVAAYDDRGVPLCARCVDEKSGRGEQLTLV